MGKIKSFMTSPVTWKQVTILSLISFILTGAAYIYVSADIWGEWLKENLKTNSKKKKR